MQLVFQFANIKQFFEMSGHGPYVWACYIITLAGIAYLALAPLLAKRRFMRTQKSISRREAI